MRWETMPETIVSLKNVDLRYFIRKDLSLTVFENLDFKVKQNDWISIGGPSGSGKTSLLKLMIQELSPVSGTIVVKNPEKCIYIPQEPFLHPYLTIYENLLFVKEDPSIAENLLSEFQLQIVKNSYPDEISGGELIKSSFAYSLMHAPDVLFIDEPTSSLDINNISLIISILNSLHEQGKTIVVVSHSKSLHKSGHKHYLIENKRIVPGRIE